MHSSSRSRVTTLSTAVGDIRRTSHSRVSGPRARTTSFVVSMFAIGCLWASPWREASAQTFGPKTDFATGNYPYSVAIADLDGDGRPDLAVTNSSSATISVLLGTGGGSFGRNTEFATGFNPRSVAIGDLDGDGRPDLAVANTSSSTVSVLLGTGGGSFGPKTDFSTLSGPYSVAIGDLDGDGRPDLAVASVDSSKVSVLLGTGRGSFGPKTDFATGVNPRSVAIGDLDGDGRPDLVTANSGSYTVSVLLGTGGGSFGPNTDFAAGSLPYSVAIGDLDGDGRPDLAVTNYNTVLVLLGTGGGSFGPNTYFATGSFSISVAIGDLDGDARPDLAVANNSANTVSVLLGTGGGSFGPKTDFATGSGPYSVAIGDLDGDGRPDLAAANSGSNTVSVLLARTAAPTPEEQVATLGNDVQALITGGTLTPSQGAALQTKLDAALHLLDQGNTQGAIGKLGDFIKQINSYIKSGKLTAAAGQPLIDAANALIAELQAPQAASARTPAAPSSRDAMEGSSAMAPAPFHLYASTFDAARGTITLRFDLPRRSDVTLELFDVAGRRVAELRLGSMGQGRQEWTSAMLRLPSAMFLYRLHAGELMSAGKISLVR